MPTRGYYRRHRGVPKHHIMDRADRRANAAALVADRGCAVISEFFLAVAPRPRVFAVVQRLSVRSVHSALLIASTGFKRLVQKLIRPGDR